MKINRNRITTNSPKGFCFVHARAAFDNNDFGLITTQPLRLSGSDIFYGIHMVKTYDGGESWSELIPSKTITRKPYGDNLEITFMDATPTYHKKCGKILLTGIATFYSGDEHLPEPAPAEIAYAVYDYEKGDFDDFKILSVGDKDKYFHAGSGCCQIFELECGDVLIPIYYNDKESAADTWNSLSFVSVVRCSFDGENLEVKDVGEEFTIDVPRGLGEPSVISFKDKFYLALRNDVSGYVAESVDGINYSEPVELSFDDGENAGNYNTQQHWFTLGDKLYLVYTRKGASNDHVFRHRAPLFAAEFDTERMCLVRSTEKVVVPERGARLGNFGCTQKSENEAYVIAAEWMQSIKNENPWEECAAFGSDNSIWCVKLSD